MSASSLPWYYANREYAQRRARQWKAQHREHVRAYSKARRQRNNALARRRYRESSAERVRIARKQSQYREMHPGYVRELYRRNPEHYQRRSFEYRIKSLSPKIQAMRRVLWELKRWCRLHDRSLDIRIS